MDSSNGKEPNWNLVMKWNKLDSSNGMEQTFFVKAQAIILR